MLFEKLKQFRFFTRKKLTFAGESQTGLVRKSNEDRFFYISNPHERNAFAVVADGIGGKIRYRLDDAFGIGIGYLGA